MSWALPFKPGHIWESTAQGAIPSGIVGTTFLDPENGTLLQVVKNTDASALAGCEPVAWEDALNYEVEKNATSGAKDGAGIVHPAYANRGVTVPVNAAFMIVKRGPTHALAGAVVSAQDSLILDGTAGRVQGGVAADDPAAVYGVIYESGNANDSVFCNVNFP